MTRAVPDSAPNMCEDGGMSDMSVSSIVIFAVFGIIALALVVVAVLSISERIIPLVERRLGGASVRESLGNWVMDVRHRTRRRDDEDEGDDLDDDTAALLSMLSKGTVVVDDQDEVVRANPEAYRLGVVADDAIVNPDIMAAVRQVRTAGGRRSFDLETNTPERYATHIDSRSSSDGPSSSDRVTDQKGDDAPAGTLVTRPNWLKVTVGRIDERLVIVLIDDVSDAIRFSQTRDAFIVNVSEQLLKPTAALERLSETLEQDEHDEERLRRDAREVRKASEHLNHLVGDLLLLIKAQAPIIPSTANRLNVMDQLRAVRAATARQAQRAGVDLRVGGDDTLVINGEAEQIRSAVIKLVENAIAYSPSGATVSISARREDDHAVIRVIDQGRGIPKSEQSRIFERFYRGANQSERSEDGVGLGLAIVKHVALTHHGSAGVWSMPGEGSTFSLTLPLAQ